MASSPDDMRVRIEAYPWPSWRGGVEVVRANKGYTLHSLRTGGPLPLPCGSWVSARRLALPSTIVC